MTRIPIAAALLVSLGTGALAQDAEDLVRQRTEAWFAGWSPGKAPWTGEALRPLYAEGDGALHVVDEFGSEVVVIDSFSEYVETWAPMMAEGFRVWSIKPVGEVDVRVGGDLGYATFLWEAEATTTDGIAIAPRQHGTLLWSQVAPGDWRIVHEHLTIARAATTAATDGRTVRERILAWGEAWVVGDDAETFDLEAAIRPYYVDDLLAFDTSDDAGRTVIHGWDQFVETWQPFINQWDEWRFVIDPDSLDVTVIGNTAWATMFIDNHGVAQDGSEFYGPAQGTVILERRDDEWQIVHEHISIPRTIPEDQ